MKYYINLFSPVTYEAFTRSNREITGFRIKRQSAAARVHPGDKLLCYLTGLSRWVGILEVIEGPFQDSSPIFDDDNDPFVVRFRVRSDVWLPLEKGFPIHDDRVWKSLSFTKDQLKNTSSWTGKLRISLNPLDETDGTLIETLLRSQSGDGESFEVNAKEWQRQLAQKVRRADKDVLVTVPVETPPERLLDVEENNEVRESIQIQALLAEIGARMGMQIWLPRNDRTNVSKEWHGEHPTPLERLPLNYDDTTLRTIEQIDVLWLKGRSIKRAFEVEHTTSIYSGILRMADLLALQPNMNIRLHIVAPAQRRQKVFQEVRRPVFSLLEPGPLSESCTYLSYDSIRALAAEPHLSYLSDSVLDEYEEEAED